MEIKTKNLLNAKTEGNEFLKQYMINKEKESLKKAMDADNTNSNILYYYLKDPSNKAKISLYKDFLNLDICTKLNIAYLDHKSCVISVLKSVKDIEPDNLNVEALKNSLEKNIPREEIKKYSLEKENAINNIPLDIEDENLLNLIIKLDLGEKLYPIIDNTIDEKDELKDIYIKIKKECLVYVKVISEIILYYIENNQYKKAYNLLSIIHLNEKNNQETHSKIAYYIGQINKDFDEVEKSIGFSFKKYEISKVPHCPRDLANYQNLFFEQIGKILRSKCINDLIIKLKNHHKDENNLVKIDDNFIQYTIKNTIFYEFFKGKSFGITKVRELKTFINIDFRTATLRKDGIDYLFNFCIWIITALREYIGHLLKDYYYYSMNFIISHKYPKKEKLKKTMNLISEGKDKIKKEEEVEEEEVEEEEEEGGYLVEKLLFKEINRIYICDLLYILNINNWEKKLDKFSHFFTSKKRKNLIKGTTIIKPKKLDKDLLELIKKFNINIGELIVEDPDTSMECKTGNSSSYLNINITRGCGTHAKNALFKK